MLFWILDFEMDYESVLNTYLPLEVEVSEISQTDIKEIG